MIEIMVVCVFLPCKKCGFVTQQVPFDDFVSGYKAYMCTCGTVTLDVTESEKADG